MKNHNTCSGCDCESLCVEQFPFPSKVAENNKFCRFTGIKVMIFLLIFFVLAFLLKKEFWKDVQPFWLMEKNNH
jgi:preprotein translocase subunit SecG